MTSAQRAWLDDVAASMTMTTRDTLLAFMREFELTPEQAGEIVAQWVQNQLLDNASLVNAPRRRLLTR